MDEQQPVMVLETTSEIESILYRTLLQEAGLAVMVQRAGVHRLREVRYRLLVDAENAEEARALIDDYRRQVESGALHEELPEENAAEMRAAGSRSAHRWMLQRIVLALLAIALAFILLQVVSQFLR